MIKSLVISAPFGNYIQPEGATATLGTFTLKPRPGRAWAILSRIRAYPSMGGYVNKIGLRNPGIESLADEYLGEKIVSIHGFSTDDWLELIAALRKFSPEAVELNFSCPNVTDDPVDYYTVIMAAKKMKVDGLEVIVKLPPVDFEKIVRQSMSAGVLFFHACNTLPMPNGGMSGRPLKRFSVHVIRHLRKMLGEDCEIIGGGGVFCVDDIRDYYCAGADHVAVGSALLNPWRALTVSKLVRGAAVSVGRPSFHGCPTYETCS
jgi:dihydroorotate dehydrogenase